MSGTVTLLFTDIEGSTRLWEAQPARMAAVLARHDALCREVVGARGGRVVKTTGDGLYAAFDDPFEALSASPSRPCNANRGRTNSPTFAPR